MMTSVKQCSRENKFSNYIIFYILPYSLVFLFLQFIIFYPFAANDRSFIWDVDGISQHYPVLQYYGEMLRGILRGEGIPLIDFKIGMGFDTLTTLNYYAIGDPITLLTVFAKPEDMEGMYKFLILLRFYLAGFTYISYCFSRKFKGFQTVLGGLIYVFCGFLFYAGTRHPFFINPMIYLPLLILGAEQILAKKKPYLFIIIVFISGISNFYFLYMMTIIAILYGTIRYFTSYKSAYGMWIEFGKVALRSMCYYCLGILMASFLLLPMIAAFFVNGRFDSGYEVNLLHYTKGYYITMVNSFLAPGVYSGYWTQLTYAAITAVGIMIIFRYKKYLDLRIAFLITTLLLMFPAAGYFMNGMSYVSNRWVFGYSFFVALIVTSTYEDMFHFNRIDKVLLALGTLIYVGLGFIKPNKYIWIATIFLLMTLLVLFYFQDRNYNQDTNRRISTWHVKIANSMIVMVVCSNLVANGFLTYHSDYADYVSEYIKAGKVQDTIEKSAVSLIPQIPDTSFYRIETYGDSKYNEALTVGYYDVASYYSVTDGGVTDYLKGLELLNHRTAFRFDDLDQRTILDALASVKYVVTSNKKSVPYGYKLILEEKNDGKRYYLYENQYPLPIGYTYSRFISEDTYEQLSPVEKQEIMLDAIVLNSDGNISKEMLLNEADINLQTIQLETELELGEGMTYDGEVLKVTKEETKLRVYFNGIENSETYVRMENFHINQTKYYGINLKAKGDKGAAKNFNVRAKRNNAYFGKDDFLIHLGSSEEAMMYCDITFHDTGKFHLENISAYCLPMANYEEKVTALQEFVLENVIVGQNKISGTLNLTKDRILCLSIPYSKGWTAYVDGEETELLKANVMYMALPLQEGGHEIQLIYRTPYLNAGILLSGMSWIIFFGFLFVTKKGSKNWILLKKKN
ncbi:MAG: putative rane protein [Lachnospiraceae bacterium]|jgi:uncharacterized membrane protein YfhO|nr:putative rane protein [Lachnospiraceae bacterium]